MALVQVEGVLEAALRYLKNVLKKEGTILALEKTEDGWRVEMEAIDYPGAGFDPTLGLHVITLDPKLNVVSYRRTHMRKQSQLSWNPALTD